MIKKLFPLALCAFFAGAILTGCRTHEETVEKAEYILQNAKLDVAEAKRNLDQAIQDSLSDYLLFKKESEERILAHEKSIAEFKELLAIEKIENRAVYEKKLAELEQKNIALKVKLANYKKEEQDKWATFRSEFIRDMEELGKALKDFVVKNNQ